MYPTKGPAMPTTETAPRKPSRETWRDWIPAEADNDARAAAEPLLTVDELLAKLADPAEVGNAADVSRRDLSYWQAEGVVPYPTYAPFAGGRRAYYPQWMVYVVVMLRTHQADGYKLHEIGPILRGHVWNILAIPVSEKTRRMLDERTRSDEMERRLAALSGPIDAAAQAVEHATGTPVATVLVEFRTEAGDPIIWRSWVESPDDSHPTERT